MNYEINTLCFSCGSKCRVLEISMYSSDRPQGPLNKALDTPNWGFHPKQTTWTPSLLRAPEKNKGIPAAVFE